MSYIVLRMFENTAVGNLVCLLEYGHFYLVHITLSLLKSHLLRACVNRSCMD